jgi:UDP-2,4-diacetamido-2,4,6-trideoxy-beta-L-altropyranose hydrolase
MRLLIRADATTSMGTGHLMRCTALGQAWQEQRGTVEFLTRCENTALVGRLEAEGFNVRQLGANSDWDAFDAAAKSAPDAALVLDGYDFDAEYQKRARSFFQPLLVIDDLADLPRYSADLVLNQNIYAAELRYAHESHTRLLLGCQWALLRREFRRWRDWRREIPAVGRRVLVTLGGSDPDNVTLRVVQAFQCTGLADELEIQVVAGAGNPHLPELEETARASRNIRLCSNVRDMPALMAWADIAVTGAGSTCWETSFMGLPSLTIILAENQKRIAEGLERVGAAINLGCQQDLSSESIASSTDGILRARACRERLSERGRGLVDGNGSAATVVVIQELL